MEDSYRSDKEEQKSEQCMATVGMRGWCTWLTPAHCHCRGMILSKIDAATPQMLNSAWTTPWLVELDESIQATKITFI